MLEYDVERLIQLNNSNDAMTYPNFLELKQYRRFSQNVLFLFCVELGLDVVSLWRCCCCCCCLPGAFESSRSSGNMTTDANVMMVNKTHATNAGALLSHVNRNAPNVGPAIHAPVAADCNLPIWMARSSSAVSRVMMDVDTVMVCLTNPTNTREKRSMPKLPYAIRKYETAEPPNDKYRIVLRRSSLASVIAPNMRPPTIWDVLKTDDSNSRWLALETPAIL
mmetsp:Transcript_4294/g.12265  ORF Transcript_4294/g.12265 Transcript_4294/m.12265 type:complete len:222 (-) Transcript_4294:405-1070(-)